MEKLNEDLFRKAIFETIKLWCSKEYNYSKNFKDAFINWSNDNNYDLSEYSKDYRMFLHDYSIDRTKRKETEVSAKGMVERFFIKIKENEVFEAIMVEELAIYFKENNYTTKLPISLVSKTFFLYYPQKAILYDSHVPDAIAKIMGKNKSKNYQEYFGLFEQLAGEYKVNGLKVISDRFIEIEDYLSNYYKANKFSMDENFTHFNLIKNDEWLFRRSLDKYLWFYYEQINKK